MQSDEVKVASLADWPTGPMHSVEMQGEPVLLVRDGSDVVAVGGRCPHAGAPLAEGVLHAGRLVCPWHKATFCIRSGAVLEPPAIDPLPRFEVRLDGHDVWLRRADVPANPVGPADGRTFVVVGAGAAGAVAAQTLRQAGFGGRLILLDRENRVPYDRTLLSKYALSGLEGGEKSPLQSQAFYREQGIERHTGEATRVDPERRRIVCADGVELAYDQALLATGSVPTRPPWPGVELGGVFLLRSRADADAILAQAERSERAVVVGASFIGMEVAASLRERGLDVVVVGKEEVPFAKLLGPEVGLAFRGLHETHGVTFQLGREVAALEGHGKVRGVLLDTGERVPADLVVIGAGVRPASIPIVGLPAGKDGGITVDATLRAADGLYIAGDLARFPAYGDGSPIRVEHWRVAEQHGRVAGLNMLGKTTTYDAPPVFWTIQYLKRLDYVGHAEHWDEIVFDGEPGSLTFLAYYIKDGIVAAAAGMDRDKDMAALAELFRHRHDWSAAALGTDPLEILSGLAANKSAAR